MKYIFVTIMSIASVLLVGCEVQYGEQLNNSRKDSATEVVEIVTLSKKEINVDSSKGETDKPATVYSDLVQATVVKVVDGDTIDIKRKGATERIRFILVNAPESKGKFEGNPQPFGVEASNFTNSLLINKDVWLEYDIEQTDRYGRTLAYVWLDEVNYEYNGNQYHEKEVMINELLLKHGLAHVAVYEPNIKYKERFYTIENEAKQNRVGIWE